MTINIIFTAQYNTIQHRRHATLIYTKASSASAKHRTERVAKESTFHSTPCYTNNKPTDESMLIIKSDISHYETAVTMIMPFVKNDKYNCYRLSSVSTI